MVVIISIIFLGYFNQDKILNAFKAKANELLVTEVSVKHIDLTFIEDFPNISVKLDQTVIFDAIPGSTDTLLVAQNVYFSLDIISLIKGNYTVDEIFLKNAHVNIKIDEEGNNNYSIFKENKKDTTTAFQFNLEKIAFENVGIHYIDQRINNNHKVRVETLLAKISVSDKHFDIDLAGKLFAHHIGIKGEQYLTNKPIALACELEFLQSTKKLLIKPSSITIGESKFNIQGSYVNNSDNTTHVTVSGDETNIQTIIALLPNEASNKLKEYKSEGTVYFNGKIDGNINTKESPEIVFDFGFENISFYHPSTKQTIKNASLKGHYTNGKDKSTSTSVLQLKDVKGSIGSGSFSGDFYYQNFDHPYLRMHLNANLDIKNILELYPIDAISQPQGKILAQAHFEGLLSDLKQNTQKVKSNGAFSIKNAGFTHKTNGLKYTNIQGDFMFNNNDLGITNFSGNAGKSDFSFNGFFKNFVAYVFIKNVELKMEAGFNSNMLDLDELLANPNSSTSANESNYRLKVSPKMAFDLDCNIKNLKFRNIKDDNIAKNIVGDLHLSQQKINFNSISFAIAGGKFETAGQLNLKDTSNYTANLSGQISHFKMDRVFHVFEDFGQTFLTNKNLSGTLNAAFDVHLAFDNGLNFKRHKLLSNINMTIDNGKLMNLEPLEEMGFFMRRNNYDKYLKDKDLSTVHFSQLKNSLHIENEIITIPEMEIKSSSADFNIKGTHSFNNEIDYYVSIPIINYERRADREDAGIKVNKNTGEFYLYMQILGTVDEFEIIIDKKHTVEAAKEKIGNEIKNLVAPEKTTPNFIQLDVEDTTDMIDYDDL